MVQKAMEFITRSIASKHAILKLQLQIYQNTGPTKYFISVFNNIFNIFEFDHLHVGLRFQGLILSFWEILAKYKPRYN